MVDWISTFTHGYDIDGNVTESEQVNTIGVHNDLSSFNSVIGEDKQFLIEAL